MRVRCKGPANENAPGIPGRLFQARASVRQHFGLPFGFFLLATTITPFGVGLRHGFR